MDLSIKAGHLCALITFVWGATTALILLFNGGHIILNIPLSLTYSCSYCQQSSV